MQAGKYRNITQFLVMVAALQSGTGIALTKGVLIQKEVAETIHKAAYSMGASVHIPRCLFPVPTEYFRSCISVRGFVLFCFSPISRDQEHLELPPENQEMKQSGVSFVIIIAESKE